MTPSEALQTQVLAWFFSHQHTILTKSMLPKLPAFKSLEKSLLFSAISSLEEKGLLELTKLSTGPNASEVIRISPAGCHYARAKGLSQAA